ncbi:glycosyltransferase [Diplocloster agilis]|uniref:glycosyltransferase n=1 Tax=Diplocloster agilis TaxID=2850323 RepID=UPI0008223BD5|nr:glycosyltransferase [Suonthocola fibrivorans]MCU6733090.1 glycosyltransferase [Suonthocola fibrivorans]SCI75089.1 Spore coat polysaccharide biosynthesis protein spsA [uncultured Clostridium sp.]
MKSVLVVMSTYNGERFLKAQIDSILEQKYVQVTLKIRDDGSSDRTPDIIKSYGKQYDNICYDLGDNIGFRKSFFDTLIHSEDQYDYYAFADQDDVWDTEKLYQAVTCLEKESNELKLYASGLRVVDENLNFMYNNRFKGIRITYGSALTRQRLAGCTMVFSAALFRLCGRFHITEKMGNLFSHDAAVYYICLACGGTVVFEPDGYINFRRHSGTVTEHGKGLLGRISSVTNIFGKFKNRRYRQVQMLFQFYEDRMPESIKNTSNRILNYRSSFIKTISLMFFRELDCGIFSVDFINKFAILLRCY